MKTTWYIVEATIIGTKGKSFRLIHVEAGTIPKLWLLQL